MEISYIGLGSCCSPAAALRGLQLRNYALPFDWVVSSISALQTCIMDDFKSYHTHLYITNKRTRIIDKYGFEFPHDYPTIDVCDNIHIGEGIISETHILDGWERLCS